MFCGGEDLRCGMYEYRVYVPYVLHLVVRYSIMLIPRARALHVRATRHSKPEVNKLRHRGAFVLWR